MKVKCISDKWCGGYIKENTIYTVYSILMSNDGLYYLLSNPNEVKNLPMDHSAEMFKITDNLLPMMWYFGHNFEKKEKIPLLPFGVTEKWSMIQIIM